QRPAGAGHVPAEPGHGQHERGQRLHGDGAAGGAGGQPERGPAGAGQGLRGEHPGRGAAGGAAKATA
ncbi:hypothetical protein DZC73_29045, partial [Albitalea terrae]